VWRRRRCRRAVKVLTAFMNDVACGRQHIVVSLLIMFVIMESLTIRVLCSEPSAAVCSTLGASMQC